MRARAAAYGMEMHDAATGEILFGQFTGVGHRPGRGRGHRPAPTWARRSGRSTERGTARPGGCYSADGELISNTIPAANFADLVGR